MSGTNTSWGAQEQNERIISALAWVIVVILLFYASVFVYKRFAASPGDAVTVAATDPASASPPPTTGAVRTGVFPVATPRVTAATPPVTSQPTSRPVPTVAPTPTPSALPTPPAATTRPTATSVPTPTSAPTPTTVASATPPPVAERMFTLLVGEFGSDAAAMAAARSIDGLSAYSFTPVRDPITGSTVLRVGRFSAPRDAQLAMASLRAGNPRIRILVTPMTDETSLPPVRPPVTVVPVPTPSASVPPVPTPTPTPAVTRIPTAVPTEAPTRVAVLPTPPPTRLPVVPTEPPTVRPVPPTTRPVPTPTVVPAATPRPALRPMGEGADLDMGPPAPSGWSIQIGSFSRPLNAVNLRKLAASAGLEAFVVEAESRGVMWYRVQVGTYGSQAAADAERASLEERLGQPTIVVRRP